MPQSVYNIPEGMLYDQRRLIVSDMNRLKQCSQEE